MMDQSDISYALKLHQLKFLNSHFFNLLNIPLADNCRYLGITILTKKKTQ